MKQNRRVVVNGVTFSVPPRLSRIDSASTHGWQVRYCGDGDRSRLFSDGKKGPAASFRAAVADLKRRYQAAPPKVASSVRETPLAHKTSDLPAGISGPVLMHKPGRAPHAEFKVTLPRRGRPNAGTSVYIGTERTWTAQRYEAALAKAVKLRDAAVEQFNATLVDG